MTKKSTVASLKKQLAETEAKLASLRESRAKAKAPKTLGAAMLIESEMEKYSLILSARAIPDRLQDFAERIAKIEADDLMPVTDEYKKLFGQEKGIRFQRETVGALRALMDQLQKTKDTINSNIDALETGAPMNGMADNAGLDDAGLDDAGMGDMGDGMGGEPALDGAADEMGGEELPADDMGGEEIGDEMGGEELPPEAPAPEMEPGLGRAMKEAAQLRASSDPDAIILEAFVSTMRSGKTAKAAAKIVAERYSIDVADVKDIVKEAAATRRPFLSERSWFGRDRGSSVIPTGRMALIAELEKDADALRAVEIYKARMVKGAGQGEFILSADRPSVKLPPHLDTTDLTLQLNQVYRILLKRYKVSLEYMEACIDEMACGPDPYDPRDLENL